MVLSPSIIYSYMHSPLEHLAASLLSAELAYIFSLQNGGSKLEDVCE